MNDDATRPASGTQAARGDRPDALDRTAFENQRATFGDERILRFLGMLADEIRRRRLAIDEAAGRDARTELSQHAHALASAAGNLGFRHLLDYGRSFEREITTLPADELVAGLEELRHSMADAESAIVSLQDRLQADRRAAD